MKWKVHLNECVNIIIDVVPPFPVLKCVRSWGYSFHFCPKPKGRQDSATLQSARLGAALPVCSGAAPKGAAAAALATLGAQCREALGTTGPRQARAGPSIDLRDGQERHDGATRVTFSVYCDGSRVVILFDVVALRRLTPVFEAI